MTCHLIFCNSSPSFMIVSWFIVFFLHLLIVFVILLKINPHTSQASCVMRLHRGKISFNPCALRMAKTPIEFWLSECKRVNVCKYFQPSLNTNTYQVWSGSPQFAKIICWTFLGISSTLYMPCQACICACQFENAVCFARKIFFSQVCSKNSYSHYLKKSKWIGFF